MFAASGYKNFVESYVMSGESVTLPEFLEKVRAVVVEHTVVYMTGILDIPML